MKLESDVDENDKKSWIRLMLSEKDRFVHPIRHLIFIRFLFGSVKKFESYNEDYKPFGDGPWPCLNPVADHYKKLTINDCDIKPRKNISEPVGTFKCSCGFTYSRQGPDKTENDKYRYGRIVQFGYVWEDKLRDLVLNSNLSIAKIAKEMKCYRNTVIKYATIMGIFDKLNTKLRIQAKPYEKK